MKKTIGVISILVILIGIGCLSLWKCSPEKTQEPSDIAVTKTETVPKKDEAPPVKSDVIGLSITSPKNGDEVNSKPLTITGTIEFSGKFHEKYSIKLYKYIDNGYYWQNTTVLFSGKQWQGQVYLQERDFSPTVEKQGLKKEGIVAIIYDKSKVEQLPGKRKPHDKIDEVDITNFLPKELSTNRSLVVEVISTIPAK